MKNLNIDYALLATQKLALLTDPFCNTDAGQGLISLIDAIQDEAVKNGEPESIVFPLLLKEENDGANFQAIPFPEPTTNAQTNLIEAQIVLLLEMAADPEMGVNQVGWINDDLDFIEVAYKRNNPDGDRQQEYADEIKRKETQYINFKEAMYLLNTRIENSL